MKIPYFRFFPDDWLASHTIHKLTHAEEGIYIRLLAIAWTMSECMLPDNLDLLIRLCRGARRESIKKVLATCFQKTDEGYLNIRLKNERKTADDIKLKRSYAAKCLHNKESQPAHAEHMQSTCTANQNQNQNHKKKKTTPPTPPGGSVEFQLPIWIPPDAWTAFEEMRRRIRKPMTNRARELIAKELESLMRKGEDVRTVLEQSIRKSWQDVYAVKVNEKGNGKEPKTFEQLRCESNATAREGAARILGIRRGGVGQPPVLDQRVIGDGHGEGIVDQTPIDVLAGEITKPE